MTSSSSGGLRDASDVALVMPFGIPIPPSPASSAVLLDAIQERGIQWVPDVRVTALDPARRMALLSDGGELPYDLFLGVPVHRAPSVVLHSHLAEDGWVPVDRLTLETRFPNVYAVGDVTSVGTPKAGVFAEGQATIVATRLFAQVGRGADGTVTTYEVEGCATSKWDRARWPRST
jgi:sulfide:quinone oxidoreductase